MPLLQQETRHQEEKGKKKKSKCFIFLNIHEFFLKLLDLRGRQGGKACEFFADVGCRSALAGAVGAGRERWRRPVKEWAGGGGGGGFGGK